MREFKRLTPTVPGEAGAFLFPGGRVVTGFVTGGPTEGRGFPQWGAVDAKKAHYFGEVSGEGVTVSLCGRMRGNAKGVFGAGNVQRCKDCERRYTKALRAGRRI